MLHSLQERTALRCACDEHQAEVINILLKSGADIQSVEIAEVIDKGHEYVSLNTQHVHCLYSLILLSPFFALA